MYWAYLLLFMAMVVTPELTRDGVLFFSEADLEAVLIFCFGMLGLLLYLGKESAFLRAVREKLSLQQEANQIRKDLSQSYSYIGEMNRRIEILRNMIVSLTRTETPLSERKGVERYNPILEATRLLAQTDSVALVFVDVGKQEVLEQYEVGDRKRLGGKQSITGKHLLKTKKYIWEEGKLSFVRSPEEADGIAAFLIFHKIKNQVEEMGIFNILAAQAIYVYSLNGTSRSELDKSRQTFRV